MAVVFVDEHQRIRHGRFREYVLQSLWKTGFQRGAVLSEMSCAWNFPLGGSSRVVNDDRRILLLFLIAFVVTTNESADYQQLSWHGESVHQKGACWHLLSPFPGAIKRD